MKKSFLGYKRKDGSVGIRNKLLKVDSELKIISKGGKVFLTC